MVNSVRPEIVLGRIRPHPDGADGDHRVGLVREGDAVDGVDHAGGAKKRVAALIHGKGPGMSFLALDGDAKTALALSAQDHADRFALRFQEGTLFDVSLEIGVHRIAAHRLGPGVADALQLLAHGVAVGVGASEPAIQLVHAGEYARRNHGGLEAYPLFVGPHDHVDGRFGLDVGVVQGAHHLEPRQHPVDAVELSAERPGCPGGFPS